MNANIYQDFVQRYVSTYLRASIDKKEPQVFFIGDMVDRVGLEPENNKFKITLQDSKGEQYIRPYCDIVFDYALPRSRVVDLPDATYFVCQKADRQWRRGISPHTYSVVSPLAYLYQEMEENLSYKYLFNKSIASMFGSRSGSRTSWFNLIPNMYDPKYPSMIEAHQMLEQSIKISVAFSTHYWLSLSAHTDGFLLWRDQLPIAEIDKKNPFIINCYENGLFKQELSDYLRKKGFHNVTFN